MKPVLKFAALGVLATVAAVGLSVSSNAASLMFDAIAHFDGDAARTNLLVPVGYGGGQKKEGSWGSEDDDNDDYKSKKQSGDDADEDYEPKKKKAGDYEDEDYKPKKKKAGDYEDDHKPKKKGGWDKDGGYGGKGSSSGGGSSGDDASGGASGSPGPGSKAAKAACIARCREDCKQDAIANHKFEIDPTCVSNCTPRCGL